MNSILNALVAPELHDPVRLPTYPVIERTSVLGFNVPSTLELQSADTRLLLTRQPVYPVWADQTFTGWTNGATWVSTALPALGTGAAVLNLDFPDALDYAFTGPQIAGTASSPGPAIIGGFSYLPYTGATPIIGQFASKNYVYVPAGYLMGVLVGSYTGICLVAANVTATLVERINDEDVRFTISCTIASNRTSGFVSLAPTTRDRWISLLDVSLQGAAALTVLDRYFVTTMAFGASSAGFTASATPGDHGTITLTTAAVTGLLPLAMAPDYAVTQLPWRHCRTTASATSLINVSTILAKSGSILAGRIDPIRYWPFSTTKTIVSNLHKSDKCVSSLQNGFYTYIPPSSDVATFADYTVFAERNTPFLPLYRLDNYSICHVLYLSNLAADKQNISLSISWHLEFRNTSTLFPIGISRATIEQMHQAQLKFMTMGFFHPNSNIPALLKSAFRGGLDDKKPNVRPPPSRLMSQAQGTRQPRENRRKRQVKQNTRVANTRKQPTPKTPKRKGGLQMYLDSRK